MTLVSTIITSAYRETNLVPLVGTPTALEAAEGLARLNSIIRSVIGNEAGNDLRDLHIDGDFSQVSQCSSSIPDDVRLILNLESTRTLQADPTPVDGQRLAVIDVLGNLATYPLTIDGNGRLIEGAATVTLNTNSEARQWMYRADIGNWVKITTLVESDSLPFPEDFDDYFITALALRLAPRHSTKLGDESLAAHKRSRGQLRARYNKPRTIRSDLTPRTSNPNTYYKTSDFDTGDIDPWL